MFRCKSTASNGVCSDFHLDESSKITIKTQEGVENYKVFFLFSTVTVKEIPLLLVLQQSIKIWISRTVFHLLAADLWISSHPVSNGTQLLPFHRTSREEGRCWSEI